MSLLTRTFLEAAMYTAKEACEKGAQHALRYFKTDIISDAKEDASPVTIADKEAEALIIEILRRRFPEHSILGEENGLLAGDPNFRWIIDPIDGTRGFIRGGSFWGTLIGLEHQGCIVAGAMCLPVAQLTYWAGKDLGCYRNGTRIMIGGESQLNKATLSVGEIQHILKSPHQESLLQLIGTCASTRGYGDPGGLMMVLEGLADIWIEGGVKPWDLAHAQILIQEAGGVFSDFTGRETIESGQAIASNRSLHPIVLECMKQGR